MYRNSVKVEQANRKRLKVLFENYWDSAYILTSSSNSINEYSTRIHHAHVPIYTINDYILLCYYNIGAVIEMCVGTNCLRT